jgi:hypothetical protein
LRENGLTLQVIWTNGGGYDLRESPARVIVPGEWLTTHAGLISAVLAAIRVDPPRRQLIQESVTRKPPRQLQRKLQLRVNAAQQVRRPAHRDVIGGRSAAFSVIAGNRVPGGAQRKSKAHL